MNVSVVAGKPSISVGERTIQWAPIASPVRLHFDGTSCAEVAAALMQAFGEFPIRLHKGEQLMILKGMVAAAGEARRPYEELLRALAQVGELEVTQS